MEDQFDLVIDAGNTRTKIGWVRNDRIVQWTVVDHIDGTRLNDVLEGKLPNAVTIGSVGRATDRLVEFFERELPVLVVNGNTPLPIRNAYSTPTTLGADRIANAVGAHKVFNGRPALVIDAGTCITYDLVEADGTFVGGAISPGMKMRSKAMNAYSAALPLVDPPEHPALIGGSTVDSLASGIHHGMMAEVQGMIQMFRHQRTGIAVIITGGDALGIARALKSGIFAHPILTLVGLHAIFVHNRDAHGFDGDRGTHRRKGTRPAG